MRKGLKCPSAGTLFASGCSTLYQTLVCKDCKRETFELQKLAELMFDYGYAYGLVCGTPVLRERISVLVKQVGIWVNKVNYFCEVYFPKILAKHGQSGVRVGL